MEKPTPIPHDELRPGMIVYENYQDLPEIADLEKFPQETACVIISNLATGELFSVRIHDENTVDESGGMVICARSISKLLERWSPDSRYPKEFYRTQRDALLAGIAREREIAAERVVELDRLEKSAPKLST